MGTLAFDIETVVPDGDPTTASLEDHEVFCVCAAHRPAPDATVETATFVREEWGPTGELAVLSETLDWFDAHRADRVLTYNGREFDVPRLRARARASIEALESSSPVETRLETFLATHEHVDLFSELAEPFERTHGHRPSFENACEALDIDVPRTPIEEYELDFVDFPAHRSTTQAMAPYLLGVDVPVLGAQYLDLLEVGATDTKTVADIAAAIDHYARTDVDPLFALWDCRPYGDTL